MGLPLYHLFSKKKKKKELTVHQKSYSSKKLTRVSELKCSSYGTGSYQNMTILDMSQAFMPAWSLWSKLLHLSIIVRWVLHFDKFI